MADAWITGVGVAIGGLGVLIGWFVSGTQRVREKLTEERRDAYRQLLLSWDAVRRGGEPDSETILQERAAVARFLSSEQMFTSECVGSLIADVRTREGNERRAWFEAVARLETQHNSERLRRRHRVAYTDPTWRWPS